MERRVIKALSALKEGQIVLLRDDVGASGGVAFLLAPAERISEATVRFMVNEGRGVICAALPEARLSELGLPMMAPRVSEAGQDFAVSVDARQGITTGISIPDRVKALRMLATTDDPKRDLVMPGHIFPWRAKTGGVLVRSGVAEAAVDLLVEADLTPTAALCHCLSPRGDLMTESELESLCHTNGFIHVSISDVVRHMMGQRSIIEPIAESMLPTRLAGTFRAYGFRSVTDDAEHLALVKGKVDERDEDGQVTPILVRVQAEHGIGDLLGTAAFSSRQLLAGALKEIEREGRGVFVYVRHPRQGRLRRHLRALAAGAPSASPAATIREYGIGAQILRHLGVQRLILLTNSQRDIPGIEAYRLEIVGRRPFAPAPADRAELVTDVTGTRT